LTCADEISPVAGQLERVVGRGNVPSPYDRWGARLLAHLTRPLQIAVTGLPGSGKSALIEMLSGQPALGHTRSDAVIEMAYGEQPRVVFERRDGSVISSPGLLKTASWPENAVCARQELPESRLAGQTYIEVGLSGSLSRKASVLDSLAEGADIILWCSQSFDEEEQTLWTSVPDRIKDHGFLVLTMADRQMMRGVLADNIDRLDGIVAEEFVGLFPVATIQGLQAQIAAPALDQSLWSSSGGKSLMEALNRQITRGRAADIDHATMFMDRLAARFPELFETAGSGTEIAQTRSVAPRPADEPADKTGMGEPVFADVPLSVTDEGSVQLLTRAAELLQQSAARMLDDLDGTGTLDPDAVLSSCSEALSSLGSLLDTASPEDMAALAAREDVQDGEEMLMLFQIECGEEAALDAASLLLQLRKDFIDRAAG